MRILSLVAVGGVARAHLEFLAQELATRLRVACSIHPDGLDVDFAFNPLRGQYHSTEILKQLVPQAPSENWRVLGVSEADLYVPILTFVFGEAQLGGPAALVSLHRLRQEFYGLAADPQILAERLLKESLHELGHTVGLRHCPDYRCVMSSAHTVERIDLKLAQFCDACACRRDLSTRGEASSLC
jgi:archaemetzincin